MVSENFLLTLDRAFKISEQTLRDAGFKIILADMNTGLIKAAPVEKKSRFSSVRVKIISENFKKSRVSVSCTSIIAFGIEDPFRNFSNEEDKIMDQIRVNAKNG